MAAMHGDDTVCLSPDLLIAFQQGRLDESRRARLERHVSECPHCSMRVESLSRLGGAEPTKTVGDRSAGAGPAEFVLNGPTPEAAPFEPTMSPGGDATSAASHPGRSESEKTGPGQRLGTYLIRDRLGAGGMGVVYEAFDEERHVRVALKVLPRVDARTLYLFKREFRALADLSHPNLVTLYEFACDAGLWFFTMERVDGWDFLSYVRPRAHEARRTVDDRRPVGLDGPRARPGRRPPEVTEAVPLPPQALPRRGEPPARSPRRRSGWSSPATAPVGRDEDARPGEAPGLDPATGRGGEGGALHAPRGELHRDLKPSNVMVSARRGGSSCSTSA